MKPEDMKLVQEYVVFRRGGDIRLSEAVTGLPNPHIWAPLGTAPTLSIKPLGQPRRTVSLSMDGQTLIKRIAETTPTRYDREAHPDCIMCNDQGFHTGPCPVCGEEEMKLHSQIRAGSGGYSYDPPGR